MNSSNINCLTDFYANFSMYSLHKAVESLIKNIVLPIYSLSRNKCLVDILGNGSLTWEKR